MTSEEQRTDLENRRQAARLNAAAAYERYQGARAVFDTAGMMTASWPRVPETVKHAMIAAVDVLRGAYEAAAEEEMLAMYKDGIIAIANKYAPGAQS
jgi:hypothetical protein